MLPEPLGELTFFFRFSPFPVPLLLVRQRRATNILPFRLFFNVLVLVIASLITAKSKSKSSPHHRRIRRRRRAALSPLPEILLCKGCLRNRQLCRAIYGFEILVRGVGEEGE